MTHSVNTGFPSTTKSQICQVYSINTATVLALRSIGRGRTAALKLFSILNIGAPVSQPAWTKHTAYLTTETAVLVENNMKQATVELKEMLSKRYAMSSPRVLNAGTSFHYSWNSMGWQERDGIVAAISQDTGKIIDIVHKILSCPVCKFKQSKRNEGSMTAIEYSFIMFYRAPIIHLVIITTLEVRMYVLVDKFR